MDRVSHTTMVVAVAVAAMPDREKTTIEIYRETWQRLNARKEGPGDSFDDVINRVLDRLDEQDG